MGDARCVVSEIREKYNVCQNVEFLCAFSWSRKAPISFVVAVCPFICPLVCPRLSARLPLDGLREI